MSLFGDLWGMLPKEIKFMFGIAVFLYAGATILNVLVIVWNVLGVNLLNAMNGCGANPTVCIPQQEGIFIFGINFADYWTVTMLIILVPIALFAIKWYSLSFAHTK